MTDHRNIVNALHAMECDEADGEVESPMGWFGYLYNDPRDNESLADNYAEILEDERVTVADVTGAWVLYCDNYGNRDAVLYTTRRDARVAFDGLVAEYNEWHAAVDDIDEDEDEHDAF